MMTEVAIFLGGLLMLVVAGLEAIWTKLSPSPHLNQENSKC